MKNETQSPHPVGSSEWLAELRGRMEKCNDRRRALMALPPLKHDMALPLPQRLEKFERLQFERISEEISIMTEALDVMNQLDILMLATK